MINKRIDAATRCQNTTRCIGTVMFLNKLLNLGITHDQVSANCEKISRGTYLNIVGAITSNEKALRCVFVKYKMPVPAGWEPIKTALRDVDITGQLTNIKGEIQLLISGVSNLNIDK